MLINDFYTINELVHEPGSISARLKWNRDHPIFAGHFPGQPVVPGVCMMQVVQEILHHCMQDHIVLKESSQMKFLQFIDPGVNPEVSIQINFSIIESSLLVTASLLEGKSIFFKFQGGYKIGKT